jgi:iron(III) transport system substrate-binding protein
MTSLSAAYKKDTGNDMSYIVGNIGDLTARVEAEKANAQADILLGGSVDLYDPLAKNGDFESYSSPANKTLKPLFNDPNGYWQGWYMGVLCILYNPDRFNKLIAPKGVSAPKTWDDLLNPAYKGEFIMGSPATAGGAQIFINDQIFRLGSEDKAWDYMKSLDKNVSQYTPGATTNIPLIGKGEFTIGMSWAHDTYKAKASGQPINIVIPADNAFEIGGSAVIKGAQNDANAKAFIDWLLSKPTQELNTANSKRYSVREDVASPDGLPALSDVKLVNYDRALAGSRVAEIKTSFASQIMANRPQ